MNNKCSECGVAEIHYLNNSYCRPCGEKNNDIYSFYCIMDIEKIINVLGKEKAKELIKECKPDRDLVIYNY
jgi:hypothetical protein